MTHSSDDRVVKVSVHMPAYNHERYIAQAIESALMQRASFDFEIVIGEDCSTDGTRAVALDFAERHPGRVRVLAHPVNLGIWENDQAIIRACRGEYIAWLESDDYWTSADKLQKQVDLLDANRDVTACFHHAGCLTDSKEPLTWRRGPRQLKPFYTLDDLLEQGHFVPSCTAVFRRSLVTTPMVWTRETPFLERTYFASFAKCGRIAFIDEEMAIFRYHATGVYGKASSVENIQSTIHSHKLLGKNLGLTDRRSYRRGLSRMYAGLSRELMREGRRGAALVALFQSAGTGIAARRPETTRD